MANPAVITRSCTLNGISSSQNTTELVDGVMTKEILLPAARAGTITSGSITLSPGHGVVTGNRLDVYWTEGSRIGCVVGTVAGNVVPVSGGVGTTLPAVAANPITCMVPQAEPFAVLAANVKVVMLVGDAPAETAAFADATPATKGTIQAGLSNSYAWNFGSGLANPITADPTQVFLSHSDSTAARNVQLIVGVL